MSSLRVVLFAGISGLLTLGCAQGGGIDAGGGGGFDAGPRLDGSGGDRDGGDLDGGGGGRDAGPVSCGAGEHACGAGCIDDLENLPANGCRLGCGEPCPTPPDGAASCESDGTCNFGCEAPFRLVDGECVCEPRTCADWGYTCGAPEDGCGMSLDCGSCSGTSTCLDGACSCSPDTREPNDDRITAPNIGSATDTPDTNLVFDTFNLHDMDDEDWYEVSVADDLDLGNPQITVTLSGIPMGDDYDLAAYYICTEGGDSSTCTSGTADNMIGRGCASARTGAVTESVELATECSTTDEGGTLLIHVSSRTVSGSCGGYELEVDVR